MRRLSTIRSTEPTVKMRENLKNAARHSIDRHDTDVRSAQVRDRAQKGKGNLSSMLKDAAKTLGPLESVIEVAEPMKTEKTTLQIDVKFNG